MFLHGDDISGTYSPAEDIYMDCNMMSDAAFADELADKVDRHTEYGLQLPNGEVAWGEYLGRRLYTPEERAHMVLVLKKTAQECGFCENEFLGHYHWTSRVATVKVTYSDTGSCYPIDSVLVTADPDKMTPDISTED